MPSTDLLGITLALTSALVWGAGDFSGGFATRRAHQYQVLALSALSGIIILVVCALLRREAMPAPGSALWAGLAGLVGACGLAAFYRALALGQAVKVAPTAAVIGAVIPVVFSIFTQGPPGTGRLVGFGLAVVGIWLVSQSAVQPGGTARQTFWLTIFAGLGFGGAMAIIRPASRDILPVRS